MGKVLQGILITVIILGSGYLVYSFVYPSEKYILRYRVERTDNCKYGSCWDSMILDAEGNWELTRKGSGDHYASGTLEDVLLAELALELPNIVGERRHILTKEELSIAEEDYEKKLDVIVNKYDLISSELAETYYFELNEKYDDSIYAEIDEGRTIGESDYEELERFDRESAKDEEDFFNGLDKLGEEFLREVKSVPKPPSGIIVDGDTKKEDCSEPGDSFVSVAFIYKNKNLSLSNCEDDIISYTDFSETVIDKIFASVETSSYVEPQFQEPTYLPNGILLDVRPVQFTIGGMAPDEFSYATRYWCRGEPINRDFSPNLLVLQEPIRKIEDSSVATSTTSYTVMTEDVAIGSLDGKYSEAHGGDQVNDLRVTWETEDLRITVMNRGGYNKKIAEDDERRAKYESDFQCTILVKEELLEIANSFKSLEGEKLDYTMTEAEWKALQAE